MTLGLLMEGLGAQSTEPVVAITHSHETPEAAWSSDEHSR